MLDIVLVIVAVAVAFGAGFDIGRLTALSDGTSGVNSSQNEGTP